MGLKIVKANCLEEVLRKGESTTEYQEVSQSVVDTLNRWSELNIRGVSALKHSAWMIDAVLFNTARDRCLVLVPHINHRPGVEMDAIQMLAGERIEGRWNYYIVGMPTMVMYKPKKPLPDGAWFKKLSKHARGEMIRGGYLKKTKCEINDSYVNDWFNSDLYRLHEELMLKLKK